MITSKPGTESCPMMVGFRALAPDANEEELRDGWARARVQAPVFYDPDRGWWCVSTYELMEEVLRQPEVFSSRVKRAVAAVPDQFREELGGDWPINPNIGGIDPPQHTRIRKLAQVGFTRSATAHRVEEIGTIANDLIDGFIQRGGADLATEYTRMIPLRTIAPILGVPAGDAMKLYTWAHQVMLMVDNPDITDDIVLGLGEAMVEFTHYANDLIEDRRANPRDDDDMLSTLIAATGDEGEPALTDRELVSLVLAAIAGGTETTATTMGHAIHTLLGEQGLWQRAIAEPDVISNIAEEALRLRPPARAIHRVTTRECQLAGVSLPADAIVHLPFMSVGRDAALFADADRFDPDRENAKKHLAFGKGTHFCLGAPLARAELRVGIECLARRIPSLRLASDCELHHLPTLAVPALTHGLTTEWDT
jgi:cytochrome P450